MTKRHMSGPGVVQICKIALNAYDFYSGRGTAWDGKYMPKLVDYLVLSLILCYYLGARR